MVSRHNHRTDCRTTISRRRLLQGLGAASAAITLPVWHAATAFGGGPSTDKHFIALFWANGTIPGEFFPTSTGPLDQLGAVVAPLEAHKSSMTILKGVHMNSTVENELGVPGANKPGGPHMKGPGAMLTGGSLLDGSFTGAGGPAGYADRISVDQTLAQSVGSDCPFPSLELGVRLKGQEPLRHISYRDADQPNPPVDDPSAVYDRLFGDLGLPPEQLEQRRHEKRSVLDFLADDIQRLEPRLAAEERVRLDAHLSGLRELEQALDAAAESCTVPDAPPEIDSQAMENFETVARLQIDLMVFAHRCELTRISTFMFANADSWQYYPFIGIDEEHHGLSHQNHDDPVVVDKLTAIGAWHAEQIAYTIDRLSEPDPAGGEPLFDRTLLLWGNELGQGNTHSWKDIPWLLAAGSQIPIATGRFFDFGDRPHNDLLLSVCHAMGRTDLSSFGIPTLCTGPLEGLLT